MIQNVIKRDGSKEPFDQEKIKNSIIGAGKSTDVSEERKNQVATEVTGIVVKSLETRDNVQTGEIGAKVLRELDRLEPKISAAWRQHQQEKRDR